MGEARSQELATRVASFVLRRTAQLNSKYLPPLSSYVVFCKLTALQVRSRLVAVAAACLQLL